MSAPFRVGDIVWDDNIPYKILKIKSDHIVVKSLEDEDDDPLIMSLYDPPLSEIESLPSEMMLRIMRNLDDNSLSNLSSVSQKTYRSLKIW